MAVQPVQQQDVWVELFSTVQSLSDTVNLSLEVLTPDHLQGPDGKVVSATTKKRLVLKALHSLKQGKDNVQVLNDHLQALQTASQQWQKTMMFASKSHEELMEQLESTNRDLYLTSERLRSVEAQRIAAVRESEAQRTHILQLETECKALQSALKQRDDELETAQFTNAEAQAQLSQLHQQVEELRKAADEAEQVRGRAVAALDGVKQEATKAAANAERHQETVAKLTADNLVFLMNLKKAEADLAAANQEKAQLKLAVEKQRGPWFDEVRLGVEERVRKAMVSAEALERDMELLKQEHTQQLQEICGQKADLEEYVSQLRNREAQLEGEMTAANAARGAAEQRQRQAEQSSEELRQKLENALAENRVLQENIKSMRQECTERWVSEQSALSKVQGLESSISTLQQHVTEQQTKLQQLQRSLDMQLGMNRQLMAKKEEMEWQLMAAMAKVEDGAGSKGPIPLNLMVSGMLQVERDKISVGPAAPASSSEAVGPALDGNGSMAASSLKAAAPAASKSLRFADEVEGLLGAAASSGAQKQAQPGSSAGHRGHTVAAGSPHFFKGDPAMLASTSTAAPPVHGQHAAAQPGLASTPKSPRFYRGDPAVLTASPSSAAASAEPYGRSNSQGEAAAGPSGTAPTQHLAASYAPAAATPRSPRFYKGDPSMLAAGPATATTSAGAPAAESASVSPSVHHQHQGVDASTPTASGQQATASAAAAGTSHSPEAPSPSTYFSGPGYLINPASAAPGSHASDRAAATRPSSSTSPQEPAGPQQQSVAFTPSSAHSMQPGVWAHVRPVGAPEPSPAGRRISAAGVVTTTAAPPRTPITKA